ncbi:hypothetical protein BDB01DRAFT_853434 [Pilobolus umbonatus]|nr:hypothetical protein BDB01DRAFT_853434 [Pilobolus umbonatus]
MQNRPRNPNLRTSHNEWENRAVSPSRNNEPIMHRPFTSTTEDKQNVDDKDNWRNRPPRRPVQSNIPGKSVAALQQHHQWLMQQQESSSGVPKGNHTGSLIKPILSKQYAQPIIGGSSMDVDSNLSYDDNEDTVSEERTMSVQDNRPRAPSRDSGSSGSVMSSQTFNYYCAQAAGTTEFKIIKEGWIYKKNALMQWKPVYAVAKHGNSVKPGGLYLYRDMKCNSHIHTYDMSEVIEISPRNQEYKQGIKWEIRMVIKKEDILLATDDVLLRKDWIESLTSIMGKVSIATQNELTSRIHSSEQMNRDLQGVAEELDAENNQLREEIETVKENLVKKERFYQKEAEEKENELKTNLEKQELLFEEELQAREHELNTEIERQRQSYETKCEILEREVIQWRTKYMELDQTMKNNPELKESQATIDSLQTQVREWRSRANELEYQVKQKEHSRESSYHNVSSDNTMSTNCLKESLSDVKFNLQVVRDQIKTSTDGPLSHIKNSMDKLCGLLEEAKTDWSGLQRDIIKFLNSENDNKDFKNSDQEHQLNLLRTDMNYLKQELLGFSPVDTSVEPKVEMPPSLTEKFDMIMQMVENIQISQLQISTTLDSTREIEDEPDKKILNILEDLCKKYEIGKVNESFSHQQKQISDWIQESREAQKTMIESMTANTRQSKPLPSNQSDTSHLYDKMSNTLQKAIEDLTELQQQGQEEQDKQIQAIGNYLQLLTNDVQNSAIPDLPALSQQLEDVVERLNGTEERLSQLNNASGQDMMLTRSIPPSDLNLSDDDKLTQIHYFVKNTEKFMERTLRVLSRYGDNPNGMEETIRRAVKGASKTQLEEIVSMQELQKQEREKVDKKMQRYEENARGYFEKSMEKMHSDLHEFTGVMYEMLERLVIQALEHSSSSLYNAPQEGNNPNQPHSFQSVMDLHIKLSNMNKVLTMEVQKLEAEKEKLEIYMKEMRHDSKMLEQQIMQKQSDMKILESEYDLLVRDAQRTRKENVTLISQELEPLFQQIARFKKWSEDEQGSSDSSDIMGYVDIGSDRKKINSSIMNDLGSYYGNTHIRETEDNEESTRKLRFSSTLSRNRNPSFSSHYSDNITENSSFQKQNDSSKMKSPLMGSRDRPNRAKSPLNGFIRRN